jgi:hypothetical protein
LHYQLGLQILEETWALLFKIVEATSLIK